MMILFLLQLSSGGYNTMPAFCPSHQPVGVSIKTYLMSNCNFHHQWAFCFFNLYLFKKKIYISIPNSTLLY
jgi:hypothetical protein